MYQIIHTKLMIYFLRKYEKVEQMDGDVHGIADLRDELNIEDDALISILGKIVAG